MMISSADNPLFKEIKRLYADARARKKSGMFVIEGARLCEDASRSGVVILTALATESAAEKYVSQWRTIEAAAEKAVRLSEALSVKLADTDTPQGIFCLCRMRDHRPLELSDDGVYLALEDVRDPGNLGTIIRTAEALGVNGLILSKGCCDLYSPKVIRAGMGGTFRLSFETAEDLPARLREIGERLATLAAVVDADAVPITEAPKSGAVAVIGNEAGGLTAETVAACTHRVTIPMAGRAESLNASMAAGIVLWELCRNKKAGDGDGN
ncbi:MAG: RNA methyltransferase [Clostridia bacterium]|nr:RNA methyltransferase [Clostridia bacterium]